MLELFSEDKDPGVCRCLELSNVEGWWQMENSSRSSARDRNSVRGKLTSPTALHCWVQQLIVSPLLSSLLFLSPTLIVSLLLSPFPSPLFSFSLLPS